MKKQDWCWFPSMPLEGTVLQLQLDTDCRAYGGVISLSFCHPSALQIQSLPRWEWKLHSGVLGTSGCQAGLHHCIWGKEFCIHSFCDPLHHNRLALCVVNTALSDILQRPFEACVIIIIESFVFSWEAFSVCLYLLSPWKRSFLLCFTVTRFMHCFFPNTVLKYFLTSWCFTVVFYLKTTRKKKLVHRP